MATVVVGGALANRYGNGGGAWVRLNWVLGLKRLGFDVFFVEEIRRDVCTDGTGTIVPFEKSVNLAFFREVTREFGLSRSSALVYAEGAETWGLDYQQLLDLAAGADLLVNLSGHLKAAPLLSRFRRKVYVDLDPGFTQLWHVESAPGAWLAGHDFYFTVGVNIGQPECPIPTGGIAWRPICPPVVLKEWPQVVATPSGAFTTVASWRGAYGPLQFEGKRLGTKVHEFRKFIELPARVGLPFEIALDIHPAEEKDLVALRRNSWHLVDPRLVAGNPHRFRRYVQGSLAEFSAAQGVYVETRSGWFSDRTAVYLASGKPALVQDTGFSRSYPRGDGLIPFRTLDEAEQGVNRLLREYESHCRAARVLAETHFDSDRVLTRFADEVGVVP